MPTIFENLWNTLFGPSAQADNNQNNNTGIPNAVGRRPVAPLLDPSILHEAYKSLGHPMVEQMELMSAAEWSAIEQNSMPGIEPDPNTRTLETLIATDRPAHTSPIEYLLQQLSADDSRIYIRGTPVREEHYEGHQILISGDAGSGKTELMLTIAGEWARGTSPLGQTLREKYDYVFYAPFQYMAKQPISERGMAEVIIQHLREKGVGIFEDTKDRRCSRAEINDRRSSNNCRIYDTFDPDPSRVLVLIDGYDRTRFCSSSVRSSMSCTTEINRVVATRPVFMLDDWIIGEDDFPCRLELAGFARQEGIVAYIEHCFTDENLRAEVISFITSNPALLELCRLPLQLQWICEKLAEIATHQQDLDRRVTVEAIYEHLLKRLTAYYEEYVESSIPAEEEQERLARAPLELVLSFMRKLSEVASNNGQWQVMPHPMFDTCLVAEAKLDTRKRKDPETDIMEVVCDLSIIRTRVVRGLNNLIQADHYFTCPSMQKYLARVLEPGIAVTLPYTARQETPAEPLYTIAPVIPAPATPESNIALQTTEQQPSNCAANYNHSELLAASLAGVSVSCVLVGVSSGLSAFTAPHVVVLIAPNLLGVYTPTALSRLYNKVLAARGESQGYTTIAEAQTSNQSVQPFDFRPSIGSAGGATLAHVGLIAMGVPTASLLGGMVVFVMVAAGVAMASKFTQSCRRHNQDNHQHIS